MSEMYITEGNIVSKDGEIIVTASQLGKMICSSQLESFSNSEKMLASIGASREYNLIKANRESPNLAYIKKNYDFNRLFRVELRLIMTNKEINLSIYAKAFIGNFTPFITFPENSILVNGKRPTVMELSEILGVKKSKMYVILSELEKAEIIKRINIGGKNIIFFNPYLYSCGLVEVNTINMFKDSIYAKGVTAEYIR